MTVKFYEKPTCTSCRKARALLEEIGVPLNRIDLNQGLSVEELDRFHDRVSPPADDTRLVALPINERLGDSKPDLR